MSPRTSAPFGRVLTAMVTPFTDSGAVDLDAAAALATHLIDHGHDGLVVSGTTGESPTTDPAEQHALLEAVLDAVGDRASVVAGAGTNDTAHSLKLAEAATAAGAHGLLVVTPYYSKPTQDGILAHFRAIADVSASPVMVYDIPGRTGVKLGADTLARAAEHPRIAAVKEASADLYAGSWLLRSTDLVIYSGDDALNLAWLAVGAVGVVSVIGHVVGDRLADMIAALDAGDLESARKIDQSLLPVTEAIMTRAPGAVMAKAALELLGLLPNRVVRAPHLPATDEQVAQLRLDLVTAHLLEDTRA
ncbi:MAG TPA: 4-hydroxy-tetrahydrodipicolinate synthase [Nocardioidaceae bacterium]|nr:4-hydroxy-tetrahydrodipicolinate synthase [Nocardioidaceae bacterium]